jgi:hypothetical protein
MVLKTYLGNQHLRFSVQFTVNCPTLLFKLCHAYHFDSTLHVRVTIGTENVDDNVYLQDNGLQGCCFRYRV